MTKKEKILNDKCNEEMEKIMFQAMQKITDAGESFGKDKWSCYMSILSSVALSLTITFVDKYHDTTGKTYIAITSEFVDALFAALKNKDK